jgi:hypothetical protein
MKVKSHFALAWEDATLSEVGLALTFRKARQQESCHPAGLVELDVMLPGYTFSALCFGCDIAQFCDALEKCHKTLNGRAEFVNQEGSVRFVVSVTDSGRGQFAVGGEIQLPGNDAPTAGVLPLPGIRFTFDGLVLEQSYIPAIVSRLRIFLSEQGVSTLHPMLAGS